MSQCPVDALRACVFIYLPYMNTKPYMSSYNKRIIILIYTKDCSDTEGYKNQTNFVATFTVTERIVFSV